VTVHRFSGARHSLGAGDAIRAALESGGVEFTNGDRPGEVEGEIARILLACFKDLGYSYQNLNLNRIEQASE